jgi:hypothetical protein
MAQLSVEMEITAAAFNGANKMTCTLEYRLINEANQNVSASKTVPLEILDTADFAEAAEIFRIKHDEAVMWGQWLVAAQKAPALVGKKRRTIIA